MTVLPPLPAGEVDVVAAGVTLDHEQRAPGTPLPRSLRRLPASVQSV